MGIRKRTILLLVVVLIMVAGAVYGVTIKYFLGSEGEVLLSTTITLTKLDSEKSYCFDLTKGDHIQIDWSVTAGDRIAFLVSNSTFTFIAVYDFSWSHLWPSAECPPDYHPPSGRYTFLFYTVGNSSTVTIRLVRKAL